MSIFANVFDWIKLETSAIGRFLWPLIQKFFQDEVAMLIPLAISAVTKVASDPTMTGQAWNVKLTAAVNDVQAQAIQQGIQVAMTDIVNAVQAAVNNLQAKQAIDTTKTE